jgi:hypothetical protein
MPRSLTPRVPLLMALVEAGDLDSARSVLDQIDAIGEPTSTEAQFDVAVARARLDASSAD